MDKFTRFSIAGLAGGIIKNIPVLIIHLIWDIPKIAYWDDASRIGFGKDICAKLPDYIFAIFIEVTFGIAIAMAYIYVIKYFRPKHPLISGAYLGLSTWFLLRAFMVLYKVQPFERLDMTSAAINCVIAMLFGITVVFVNNWLEKKTN